MQSTQLNFRMRSDEALPTKPISLRSFIRSGSLEECVPSSKETMVSKSIVHLSGDSEEAALAFCRNQLGQTEKTGAFIKEGPFQGYYQKYRSEDMGTITMVDPSLVLPELWSLCYKVTGIFVGFLLGTSITAYKFYLPMRFPALKDVSLSSGLKMVTPVALALGALGMFVRSYQAGRILSLYRSLKPEIQGSLESINQKNPCVQFFFDIRKETAEKIASGEWINCLDDKKIIKAPAYLGRLSAEIMIFNYVKRALETKNWDPKNPISDFSHFLRVVHLNANGYFSKWRALSETLKIQVNKYNEKLDSGKLKAKDQTGDLEQKLIKAGVKLSAPSASKDYWAMVLGGSAQFDAFEALVCNYLDASDKEGPEILNKINKLVTVKGTVSKGIQERLNGNPDLQKLLSKS